YRLLSQAALGLKTAHEAGLVHGRLDAGSFMLTPEGTLKLCGFGEPPWLSNSSKAVSDPPEADLIALGGLAASWTAAAPKRKSGKKREPLQEILRRLGPDAGDDRLSTAAALLDALDRIGSELPANAEAWDRLLQHVRENASPDVALRQSA